MKTCLLTLCVFFTLSLHLSAARYHVKKSSASADGLTWNTSFGTLQEALDAAVKGDTVWVAAGTYLPQKKYADLFRDGSPTTDRDRSFIIRDSIVVLGGFPENSTNATSLNSRDWTANRTVLSGDFNRDDDSAFGNRSDNANHVVILIGGSPEQVLDGFFIEGGNSNAPQNAYYNGNLSITITGGCGGGIYCSSYAEKLSPTLRNLHIHSNSADYEGGGLFILSLENEVSPEISNVTFMNNTANGNGSEGGYGGGLFIEGRLNKAGLTNVIIMGNSALSNGSSYGGGAYFRAIEDCKPALQNTLIAGNISNGGGGAYFNSSTATTAPVLTNVTVSANRAVPTAANFDIDGGGLMLRAMLGDVFLVIRNTAICDNLSSNSTRNEIFIRNPESKISDFVSLNSFIKGVDLGGTSLPDNTDPMFFAPADARFAPTGNQWFDYTPKVGSPLINKGSNSVVTTSKDLKGNARIYNGTVDIGAYESQGVNPPQFNEDIFKAKEVWTNAGRLYVKINSTSDLKIYSFNGLLIRKINNIGAGTYDFALPQGIYLVKSGNGKTEKVIIK